MFIASSILPALTSLKTVTVSAGNAQTKPATQPSAPNTNSSNAKVSTPHKMLNLSPKAFRSLVTLVTSRVDSLMA